MCQPQHTTQNALVPLCRQQLRFHIAAASCRVSLGCQNTIQHRVLHVTKITVPAATTGLPVDCPVDCLNKVVHASSQLHCWLTSQVASCNQLTLCCIFLPTIFIRHTNFCLDELMSMHIVAVLLPQHSTCDCLIIYLSICTP